MSRTRGSGAERSNAWVDLFQPSAEGAGLVGRGRGAPPPGGRRGDREGSTRAGDSPPRLGRAWSSGRAGDSLRAQGCTSIDPGRASRSGATGRSSASATRAVGPGEHVHSHNLAVGDIGHDYGFCEAWEPVDLVPEPLRSSFLGFRRPDGRVGTRNYVAVLASVNCSSSATVAVVDRIERSGVLADYPNVDGVIGLPHKGGCGAHIGSDGAFSSSSGRSREPFTTRTSRAT